MKIGNKDCLFSLNCIEITVTNGDYFRAANRLHLIPKSDFEHTWSKHYTIIEVDELQYIIFEVCFLQRYWFHCFLCFLRSSTGLSRHPFVTNGLMDTWTERFRDTMRMDWGCWMERDSTKAWSTELQCYGQHITPRGNAAEG